MSGPALPGLLPEGALPSGAAGATGSRGQNLASLRIVPEAAVLAVPAGTQATLAFQAFGTFQDSPGQEVDLTERTVFYVPDRYLVGSFPANGGSTFTTRLPATALEPAHRGGIVTVQAAAANADGTIITSTTQLTVRLEAEVSAPAATPLGTPALPARPAELFESAASSSAGGAAPTVYYPNDGTMLPPNLGELEVHWMPSPDSPADLYEVAFDSPTARVRHYVRCFADEGFEAGACALRLEGGAYEQIAESNRGLGPLSVSVSGATADGRVARSAPVQLEFAEQRVDGATYYWTASEPPRIMRFDFGAPGTVPETFLAPNDIPSNYACVGCHALSRDGSRLAASLDNSFNAKTIFIGDVQSRELTFNGALAPQQNRILLASFAPDASEFVAIAPGGDQTVANAARKLFFHDGETGLRRDSIDLPFQVSHPSWSPDGATIAMTQIRDGYTTQLELHGGGIAAIRRNGAAWEPPFTVVPAAPGKNRYNPDFVPDSSLLLFSESDDDGTQRGDAYSDPSARSFAVEVAAGGVPVPLTRANQGGVADLAGTELMNTFPRSTPFATLHRGRSLFWFTASSQRRAGLRRRFLPARNSPVGDAPTQVLLWMFALDPERVHAGEDGSYPGFFLPFQSLETSNHMAQWTERLVTDNPPAAAPAPPAPPYQPPPPAPPR